MVDEEVVRYLQHGLPELLRLVHGTDVAELELTDGPFRVRLHRSNPIAVEASAADMPAVAEEVPPPAGITSPRVGTFYRAGHPGMPPLVAEGSQVEEHTVVGIVESLHVLTEIEAGVRGTITRALATDGEPIEYGHVLFEVAPFE